MNPSTPIRHQTFAEIDIAALRSNIQILRKAVGQNRIVVLVVKSDAYGHGAVAVATTAQEEGITNFAVATMDEGIQLRRAEITGEVLILHPPANFDFPAVTEWHLTPSISSLDQAELFSRLTGRATLSVHAEINTGLSRLGLNWETAADQLAKLAPFPNLHLAGIYTHYRAHLSPAGDAIQEQTDRFKHVLDGLKERGINPGLRHAASSYPAAYHHNTTLFDGIRVGIIAYGAMESLPKPVDGIAPVLSVRSCVLHLRKITSGEWVHYGDGFQAKHDMTIAVIPIGYGIGYTRHLSNKGEMLVNGTRCPIVGVVGMDLTMVDVSHLTGVRIGDPVTVVGVQGDDEITALEIAQKSDTIAYEITCRLGNALPRYLVNHERAVSAKPPAATSHA